MSNKIGRFEVLSELTHSDAGVVYKVSDPEGEKTVVLKTIKLEPFGEQAPALVKTVSEEAENSKVLNSPNIASVYSVEEIDGLLCAAMEYVQGNSVATMLARKEGFSIWDLQDVARQTCQGLDHAHAKHVFHYNLEPAKIMVAWDGTVKTLGFGTSSTGSYASQATGKPPDVLHYMSPEQLRGDPVDARSNIFSLGAILYEMVTERKAFAGEDADQVRQSILEGTPDAPDQINRKIHPALSQVIMRSLSKAPEDRYQSGQELVNDLERCKESPAKIAAAKPMAQPPKGIIAPQKIAPKAPFAQPPAVKQPAVAAPAKAQERVVAKTEVKAVVPPAKVPAKNVAPARVPEAPAEAAIQPKNLESSMQSAPEVAKKTAAAAGWGGPHASFIAAKTPQASQVEAPAQFSAPDEEAPLAVASQDSAQMSAAPVIEPEIEEPKIAVDPLMAEGGGAGSSGPSFSEISELPPLKEVYIAPPPPPPPPPDIVSEPPVLFKAPVPEKPKIQPRQAARQAVKEIQKTPPQLFGYAIAGAVVIILLIVGGIAYRIHSQNADEDYSVPLPSVPAASEPAPANPAATPADATTSTPAEGQTPAETATAEPIAPQSSDISIQPKYGKKKAAKGPATPVVVPGQLTVNSTPEGAQLAIDGQNNAGWITPFNLAGVAPGQHTVTVSKNGYTTETRTIEVASGSKSFLVVQLSLTAPVVSVASVPTGAQVFLDNKDTGRVTPVQFSVDKPGNHTLTVKKEGYVEESTTANLQAGQTFRFGPSLRILGNTDDIKIKKLFGGGNKSGMGAINIKTQPKGAQIAVNQRILDKNSPVEFYLNPGNYVLDITLSGYKSIHRVIVVDQGGKIAIEETLQRE